MERNSLGTLMVVVGLAWSFHGSAQGAVDEQTPSGNQAAHSTDEQESLRVRSLVLRPDAQGPVLELHYELRGARAKEVRLDNTFVLEKSSGAKLYADQRPTTPGTLIIPDRRRLLRPGQRVTVVVAGIRQEQVLVQEASAAKG